MKAICLTSLGVAMAAVMMVGCASMGASGTEATLSAAGFDMHMADTPEKQANLAKIEPYTIIPKSDKNGELRYVYADPEKNQLYVGTQANYQEYQRMSQQQSIAMANQMAAMSYQEATLDWAVWGGGPYWW
ncbi:MAG: hypothetical protein AAF591_16155 [Verrucomicrobiota bacterium]